MRKQDNPYETWTLTDGLGKVVWIWKVLKKYQIPEHEAKNPFARWLVAAQSDATFGGWEMGDTYVRDVKESSSYLPRSKLVREINPIFREEMKELGIGIPSM
jgi:hypothetical protein